MICDYCDLDYAAEKRGALLIYEDGLEHIESAAEALRRAMLSDPYVTGEVGCAVDRLLALLERAGLVRPAEGKGGDVIGQREDDLLRRGGRTGREGPQPQGS